MDETKTDKNPDAPTVYRDAMTASWLDKSKGRLVELYMSRAPKVEGRLVAVDKRFGRVVIATDDEEVIVWLSGITQIRMPKDNGRAKREGTVK